MHRKTKVFKIFRFEVRVRGILQEQAQPISRSFKNLFKKNKLGLIRGLLKKQLPRMNVQTWRLKMIHLRGKDKSNGLIVTSGHKHSTIHNQRHSNETGARQSTRTLAHRMDKHIYNLIPTLLGTITYPLPAGSFWVDDFPNFPTWDMFSHSRRRVICNISSQPLNKRRGIPQQQNKHWQPFPHLPLASSPLDACVSSRCFNNNKAWTDCEPISQEVKASVFFPTRSYWWDSENMGY